MWPGNFSTSGTSLVVRCMARQKDHLGGSGVQKERAEQRGKEGGDILQQSPERAGEDPSLGLCKGFQTLEPPRAVQMEMKGVFFPENLLRLAGRRGRAANPAAESNGLAGDLALEGPEDEGRVRRGRGWVEDVEACLDGHVGLLDSEQGEEREEASYRPSSLPYSAMGGSCRRAIEAKPRWRGCCARNKSRMSTTSTVCVSLCLSRSPMLPLTRPSPLKA